MKTNKSYHQARQAYEERQDEDPQAQDFNHFNAKQSRSKQLSGKVSQDFTMSNKDKSHFLPFN